MSLPERIQGRKKGRRWKGHLFANEKGDFAYDLGSSWERIALEEAMAEKGFVGWLRNEPRKPWALSVSYKHRGEDRPLYPDLLVFRKVKGVIVVDVLDPHDPGRDDWVPKVKGLAEYAGKHWQSMGRIEAMILVDGNLKKLNLSIEQNRERVLSADGPQHLRSLFGSE